MSVGLPLALACARPVLNPADRIPSAVVGGENMVHLPSVREPSFATLHDRMFRPLAERWADSLARTLPPRARLAQLVVFRDTSPGGQRIGMTPGSAVGGRESVGGVLLTGGTPALIARASRTWREHRGDSELPALVWLDAAADEPPSVPGGTMFPSWLGLAAAADTAAICGAGRVAAREARALGVHGWLAPMPRREIAPLSRDVFLRCAVEDGVLFLEHGGVAAVPYLVSTNPTATLDSLEQSVAASAEAATAIEAAIRRALVTKATVVLLHEPEATAAALTGEVGGRGADSLARWLAWRSLVLARDRHLLTVHPLDALPRRRVLVLTISDDAPSGTRAARASAVPPSAGAGRERAFVAELRRLAGTSGRTTLVVRTATPRSSERVRRSLRDEVRRADLVIAAVHRRVAEDAPVAPPDSAASFTAPDSVTHAVALLRTLTGGHDAVTVAAFGDPFAGATLDSAAALLIGWNATPWSERAAARALAGTVGEGAVATLPVSLAPSLPAGSRAAVYPRFAVPGAMADAQRRRRPLTTTMTRALRDSVRRILAAGLADSAFPGAYAIVGTRTGNLVEHGVGRLDRGARARPTPSTVWDLASLTKVVGTTTGMMRLVGAGLVDLDAPVHRYLPRWTGADRDRVTVRHLLTHSSGLPSGRPLWRDAPTGDSAMAMVYATPLDAPPGTRTVYSDLGAILLGEIIETVSGEPLDRYLARRVFAPLGMTSTRFEPPASWRARVAPTEIDAWRGRHLRGEVHDENAFRLGGVAGHAGLFGSARDLARFARALLGGGALGDTRVVPRAVVPSFTRVQDAALSSRALGWDTPTGTSSAGRLMSTRAFGHTGFTGTSIWIDPGNDVFVLLLTNRVNPTRDNTRVFAVRAALADAVMSVITVPRTGSPPAPIPP